MKKEGGQVLLLVLLSMAVVITVVLSVLSSSVTDISISTREEEALRAFSAAEAGVEQTLILGTGISQTTLGDAVFSTSISTVGEGEFGYVYPEELSSGEIATLWFVSHDEDTGSLVCNSTYPCFTGRQMKVCWGDSGSASDSSTTPAVEVSVYYANTPGNYGTIRVARGTYDPNAGRRPLNRFDPADPAGCTINGFNYAFARTIDLSTLSTPIPAGVYGTANGLQMFRVRMLYNTTRAQPVGLDVNFPGNSSLPAQGDRIEATGTAGESTRKIEVFKLYADLPSIFEAAIFSPSGIIK